MHILTGGRFRVTAECATLEELSEQALGTTQCVALIGLDRNVEACLTRIASLKEKYKGLRIIVLSERLLPEQVLAAIAAGADGYLLRNEISPDAVLKSLELVLVEGVVVPQGFTKLLNGHPGIQADVSPASEILARPQKDAPPRPEPECDSAQAPGETASNHFLGRLSDREQLILMHLTKGASNKHIARELNIAEATVKVHVKSLLRKIRVSNRTQAAMWAIKHVGSAGLEINGR
jgi:two-component system nitrate/nitrite response regulator NarL